MYRKTILCTILVFFIVSCGIIYAETDVMQKVRVGLYFADASRNMDTAVSEFNISSAGGIVLNWQTDSGKNMLYAHKSSEALYVQKDTVPGHFINAYHVRIGKNFIKFEEARSFADQLNSKGIEAFPVFDGSWKVAAGFYKSRDHAVKEMENMIGNITGSTLAVMPPFQKRIIIKQNEKVLFAFSHQMGTLQFEPAEGNSPGVLSVNGSKYRGSIEVRRLSESDMTVINILGLEEYLYGVVPCEIQSGAHEEALKAQAVAARTYVLKNSGKFKDLYFDVCPTSSCQVYRGYSVEKPSTNKAVDDTKGKVVKYKGNYASTYYFSSSGGMTEDVKNVWGSEVPYLVSVSDEYESKDYWYYNWEIKYSSDVIKDRLNEKHNNIGYIMDIEITKRSEAGRVVEIVIKGSNGSIVYEKAACRSMLSSLKSQLYEITTDADVSVVNVYDQKEYKRPAGQKVLTADGLKTLSGGGNKVTVLGAGNAKRNINTIPSEYVFNGKGWGHAVGMSQEGAKGMALAGYKYDEILKHYYKGTTVE